MLDSETSTPNNESVAAQLDAIKVLAANLLDHLVTDSRSMPVSHDPDDILAAPGGLDTALLVRRKSPDSTVTEFQITVYHGTGQLLDMDNDVRLYSFNDTDSLTSDSQGLDEATRLSKISGYLHQFELLDLGQSQVTA